MARIDTNNFEQQVLKALDLQEPTVAASNVLHFNKRSGVIPSSFDFVSREPSTELRFG